MADARDGVARVDRSATLAFFIEDGRYTVPTLQFVDTDDAADVIALAWGMLDQSDHYLSVEARDGERVLCRVERG